MRFEYTVDAKFTMPILFNLKLVAVAMLYIGIVNLSPVPTAIPDG